MARLTKSPRLVSRPQGESQDSRPLRVVSGPTGVSLRNSWMLRPCSRRGLCRSSHRPLLSPSSQQVSRRWWTLGPGGPQSRIRHRAMTYDCAGRQRARCQDPPSCTVMPALHCQQPSGGRDALGLGRHLSPQLFSLGNSAPLAREDAVVERPRNSRWCQVFCPCFYRICFQGEPSSPWLGHQKRHSSD